MVKGVSRQVILVRPPEAKLFEQAIFILRDDVPRDGITDDMLLREADAIARTQKLQGVLGKGPVWACGGAASMGLLWLLVALL